MILPIHIIIALASVGAATFAFARPSKLALYASSALVVLTLATGTYLVMSLHAPLVQACTTGLAYLACVSTGIAGAWYRLARQTTK